MIKFTWMLMKFLVFCVVILVAGQLMHFHGKTLSEHVMDMVHSEMAQKHTERVKTVTKDAAKDLIETLRKKMKE